MTSGQASEQTDLPVTSLPSESRLVASDRAASTSGAAGAPIASTTLAPLGRQDYVSRFVDETHAYVREYIRNADQKAIFFFGAASALIAYLSRVGASKHWLKLPTTWSLLDTATFIGMFGLAVSAILAIAVVIPRLPGSRRGVLYFNAIAEFESAKEYSGAVLTQSGDSLLDEKAAHVHVLATICRRKYKVLRAAVWSGLVGVLGALAFMLFA